MASAPDWIGRIGLRYEDAAAMGHALCRPAHIHGAAPMVLCAPALPDARPTGKFSMEPDSVAVPTPVAIPKPSSAVLLIVKAFAIAIALVVSVSILSGVIMDLMGYV